MPDPKLDDLFNYGEDGQPVNAEEFYKQLKAWRHSADAIQTLTIPAVQRAIGGVESWGAALEELLGIVKEFLPSVLPQVQSQQTKVKECNTILCQLRDSIPGLLQGVQSTLTALKPPVTPG